PPETAAPARRGGVRPAEIIAQAERIAQAAKLDVGGIEFLVDDRDGKHYFYDVNALSNFVADPVNVVGFDPWKSFVDYLEARAGATGEWEVGTETMWITSQFPLPDA